MLWVALGNIAKHLQYDNLIHACGYLLRMRIGHGGRGKTRFCGCKEKVSLSMARMVLLLTGTSSQLVPENRF